MSLPSPSNIPYLGIPEQNPRETYYRRRDPSPSDSRNYRVGDRWMNIQSSKWFMLVSKSAGIAQWSNVSTLVGEGTLVGGVLTVPNTAIASNDRIFISRRSANGSTDLGQFTYTITPGTSFTITSVQSGEPAVTEVNDVSIIEYFIVRQL